MKRTVATVTATVTAALALAAGVIQPLPASAQATGSSAGLSSFLMPQYGTCSPHLFNKALPDWRNSDRTSVEHCDGRFAWVGQYQTDWLEAFEFRDGRWWPVEHAGTIHTGLMRGCYNDTDLRSRGASEHFISLVPICAPDELER